MFARWSQASARVHWGAIGALVLFVAALLTLAHSQQLALDVGPIALVVVILGVVAGPWNAHLRALDRRAVVGDDVAYRAARKALVAGADVPSDPELRQQTVALAHRRLRVVQGGLVRVPLVGALLGVDAAIGSPWLWLFAAVFLVGSASTWLDMWRRRHRLRERVRVLSAAATT